MKMQFLRCIGIFTPMAAVLMVGCEKKYAEPEKVIDANSAFKKGEDGSYLGPDGKKAKAPPKQMPGGMIGSKMGGPSMSGPAPGTPIQGAIPGGGVAPQKSTTP